MTSRLIGWFCLLVCSHPLLGQVNNFPVKAVTKGPRSHFVGYYDISPWDPSGRYLLAGEIDFIDRQPKPGEKLTVGMVDLKEDKYIPLDDTTAWCWQMGTRLQWLGSQTDRLIVYNSVDQDRYVAIVRDIVLGTTRKLPRPIYALSPDGTQAVTLDFDRLHRLRPGYGYQVLPEKHADNPAPKDAGIYWMDTKTGDNKLIIPIAWAAEHQKDDRFTAKAHHWFNHLLFNPSGTHFLFLHRWQKADGKSWWTRMYVARADGSDRKLLFDDGMVSHFDWRDDNTILAWARTRAAGDRFYLLDIRTRDPQVVGEGILTRDGHCSYSPNRRWILNDTYPDEKRLQTLMLFDPFQKKRHDLAQFYLSPKITGPYRCDLHPRWNRDGSLVCVDSAHTGQRQIYVVDVSALTGRK